MPNLIPKLKLRSHSASETTGHHKTHDKKLSLNTDLAKRDPKGVLSSTKPVVMSPNWEIRYDPSLSVYYYLNTETNEAQFDHPDEVVSPLASPDLSSQTYERKLFKTSVSLKRTLSPRLFSSSPSNKHGHLTRKSESSSKSDDDEDIEEFKRQLDLEIQKYETERLEKR